MMIDRPHRPQMRAFTEPGQSEAIGAALLASLVMAGTMIASGPRIVLLGSLALGALALLLTRLEWTIGGYVLINLLAVSKTSLGGGFAFSTLAGPARALALAALVLHALRCLWRRGVPVLALLTPILPLIAVIGLSLVAAPATPSRAIDALPLSAMIAALAIVAWRLTEDSSVLTRTLVAIAAAYGIALLLNIVLLPLSSRPAFLDGRFEGILENPNSVGALGFGFPALIFAALVRRRPSIMRWLFLSLATLLVVEVFMSVSRAGILGLIASATIIVVELTRRRLGIRILVILLTISAAALLALSGVTGRLSVDLRLASLSGGSGRSAAWSWAVDQIGHRPPLGYGYGSSPDLFAKFSLLDSLSPVSAGFVGSYAGNVFIDIGLELGLFGIIAFLTACAIALRRMRVGLNPQRLRPGGLAGSACLAMFIGGVVDAQGESWVLAPGGVVTVAFWFALLFTAAAGYANMTWATRTGSAWTSNV